MQAAGRVILRRAGGWLLAAGVAAGIFAAYRWAESGTPLTYVRPPERAGKMVAVRMENVSFVNQVGDRPTWSVRAEQIDLERPAASGSATFVQTAVVHNIQEGKLYDLPPEMRGIETKAPSKGIRKEDAAAGSAAALPEPPGITFQAKEGRYSTGAGETLPVELQTSYALQWQFQLTDGATLRTRAGDTLNAQTITMMELLNRRTGKLERRLLCSDGAQVRVKDMKMLANQARFNPDTRQVECLGGVRGTMQQDVVQAERLFWSLPEQRIRCPETASGTMKGTPFEATNLSIDTKRQRYHADRLQMHLAGLAGDAAQ